MAIVQMEPGIQLNCEVTDFLWPWDHTTPVLMEHGFARNARIWNSWVPQFCGTRRIFRPDVRGFGESSVPPPGFTFSVAGLVDDALAVLDYFNLERVHWIGESGGGIIGLALAVRAPERLASLVMCDSPTRTNSSTIKANAIDQPTTSQAIMKYGVGEWCRRSLYRRLDVNKASPELQDWYVQEVGKTTAPIAAVWTDYFESGALDLVPELPSMSVPTLLLCGENSGISAEYQEEIVRQMPRARLHMVRGTGHGVFLVATGECISEIRAFWAEVEAG